MAGRVARAMIRWLKPVVDRHPTVARLYREVRESRRSSKEPVETPFGFRLAGSHVMERGTFEPEETALFNALLADVDLFVNIGANVGYYCCLALSRDVPTIAVEPAAANLRHLYENIEANGWSDRIEVFPMALSRQIGLKALYGGGTGASLVPGWAGTPAHYRTVVPTTTLDHLLDGRIRNRRLLILADIEGGEFDMLAGADAVLNACPRPVWLMEIAIEHHQPAGVPINPNLRATFERLWTAGYESFTADRALRRVSAADIAAVEQAGRNLLQTQDFVFVEKGRREELLRAGRI